jgi:hypothetical protein
VWRVASAFVLGAVVGALVAVLVSGLIAPARSFAEIRSYDLTDDGRTLILTIGMGRLSSIGYIAADAESGVVRARVLLLHHLGTATSDLLLVDVRTGLSAPLGTRTVVDQEGRSIPRRVDAVTLYYKLSQSEPWSASLSGDLPANWRGSAQASLDAAGLHPLTVEQVRIAPAGTAVCLTATCPNLHALRVQLPSDERAMAMTRCFVSDPNDGTQPALRRADCQPVWRP